MHHHDRVDATDESGGFAKSAAVAWDRGRPASTIRRQRRIRREQSQRVGVADHGDSQPVWLEGGTRDVNISASVSTRITPD
jgi:hypothetical protein